MRFDRTSNGVFGRWWWTLDRHTLFALLVLQFFGALLVTASSPAVASRIGVGPYHFIHRQHIFLLLSLVVMCGVSMLPVKHIRRLATLGFVASIGLMVLLPFIGADVKGARRWINIAGLSIQPSEFLKPCMAVVMAWIFHLRSRHTGFPGWPIVAGMYVVVAGLLLLQPDFGMVITISVMWGVQFFLAGLPFVWVIAGLLAAPVGIFGAYHLLPHVKKRIDNFLDPSSGDNYQVEKSLEALTHGGWLGQGPGEGKVKLSLPDSHTDFVFSVAGEEFGMLFCLLVVVFFAFIVVRGMIKMMNEKDFFVLIAVAGLLAQFGIQAIINMGVAVSLLPAKGMTLPFLSYGGSSLIAIALGMGMMLALTRRRFGQSVVKT